MRYYSTQRPIGPGTFPKPQGNAVKEVFNFDSKTYCEEVGREAWGYIEYEQPIDPQAAADHFLVADGVGCTSCVHEAASRDMDCCWNCSRNPRRKPRDLYRHRRAGGEVICKMLV